MSEIKDTNINNNDEKIEPDMEKLFEGLTTEENISSSPEAPEQLVEFFFKNMKKCAACNEAGNNPELATAYGLKGMEAAKEIVEATGDVRDLELYAMACNAVLVVSGNKIPQDYATAREIFSEAENTWEKLYQMTGKEIYRLNKNNLINRRITKPEELGEELWKFWAQEH